jgi:xylose isomerase
MCGGAYSPETRRKYFISGPQWAAAYRGQALFWAPTRDPIGFEQVIREFGKIGIGYWCTHDSDVIPTEQLGSDAQPEITARIRKTLEENGVRCSMVTTGDVLPRSLCRRTGCRIAGKCASIPRFD